MNIGGYHIIKGFLYLFFCSAITMFWLTLFYAFFVFSSRLFYKFRYRIALNHWIAGKGKDPDEILQKPSIPLFNKRLVIIIFTISFILNVFLHFNQRQTWMGDGSKHLSAKEYWISGQVVYAHRYVFGKILHPESLILKPYTYLQRQIYTSGKKYLPEGDGEKFVWKNIWFYYPYSRKSILPYGVRDNKHSPKMETFLDEYWETIEGLANLPIADDRMRRKYQLEYPFLVSYYLLYQGHYGGPQLMSGFRIRTNPLQRERNIKMLKWIDALHSSWEMDGLLEEIREDYPYVNSYRQYIVIGLLQKLTLPLAYLGEFSCNHPYLLRLYEEYKTIMSDDPKKNAFLNLKKTNPRQASLAYKTKLYSAYGSSGNYMLNTICGKELPEEKYLLVGKGGDINHFYSASSVEHVYDNELKPLSSMRKKDGRK